MGFEKQEDDNPHRAKNLDIPKQDFSKTHEKTNDIKTQELFDDLKNISYRSQYTLEDTNKIEEGIKNAMSGGGNKDEIFIKIKEYIGYLEDDPSELIDFLSQYTAETKTGIESTAECSRTENIKILISSLMKLPSVKGKPYERFINELLQVDPNNLGAEYDALLAQLNDSETLLALTLDLQEQDRKNGTHNFEIFKSAVVSLEPGFKDKFSAIETQMMLALGTDTLQNATIKGNTIEQVSKDGFTTTAKLNDSTRHISKAGSKYAVVSDINPKTAHEEAEKIARNLRISLKPLHDELTLIKAMKNALQAKGEPRPKMEDLKADLKALSPTLYAELGLDFTDSYEALLTLLNTREATTKSKITELERNADKERADLITAMKLKAKAKDTIKKDMLNFFSRIGFDLFPKGETDLIFKWLNTNNHILYTLGANAPFDIDNNILGYNSIFSPNNKLSVESKKIFIKCFNKMLTGNTKFPIGFDSMGNIVFYETKENAESKRIATLFDMQFFCSQALGGSNRVAKMIENLKKKEE